MSLLSKLGPLAIASVVVVGFSAGANAYQCKASYETVLGSGPGQSAAIAQGQAIWTAAVKNKYGLPWSVWSIAAGPQYQCNSNGSFYQCAVMARPCKYVVQ